MILLVLYLIIKEITTNKDSYIESLLKKISSFLESVHFSVEWLLASFQQHHPTPVDFIKKERSNCSGQIYRTETVRKVYQVPLSFLGKNNWYYPKEFKFNITVPVYTLTRKDSLPRNRRNRKRGTTRQLAIKHFGN